MQNRIRWMVVAAVALVVGVIAWRLLKGSYREDVRRICFAEKNSGVDATKDAHKVEEYAKEHLDTPEGSKWFSELVAKGVSDRASTLLGRGRSDSGSTTARWCAPTSR